MDPCFFNAPPSFPRSPNLRNISTPINAWRIRVVPGHTLLAPQSNIYLRLSLPFQITLKALSIPTSRTSCMSGTCTNETRNLVMQQLAWSLQVCSALDPHVQVGAVFLVQFESLLLKVPGCIPIWMLLEMSCIPQERGNRYVGRATTRLCSMAS